MKANEIIDGVMTSINAQIRRRMGVEERQLAIAGEIKDTYMQDLCKAKLKMLERIQKDLIQVEMNAKISYMGINTD